MKRTSLPCGCGLTGYNSSGAPRLRFCAKHGKMIERMTHKQYERFRDKIIARLKAL